MSVDDALSCPRCGDDSSIAKVTGVHRSQRSELAHLLSPPSQDIRDDVGQEIGAIIGAVFGFAIPFVVLLFHPRGWVDSAIGGVILAIVGGVVGAIAGGAVDRVTGSNARERRRPEYLGKLEQWERAYYCQKHDLVFLLGDDWTGSPTDFRSLMS